MMKYLMIFLVLGIVSHSVNGVFAEEQNLDGNLMHITSSGSEKPPASIESYQGFVSRDTLDWNPGSSPTYALDISVSSQISFVTICAVIAALFLVPYFILKTKNIASRPYMSLILSGLLLHYGITTLISSVPQLSLVLYALEKGESFIIVPIFISFLIPIFVIVIAGILLYRSSVIRKLIKK